MVLGLAACGSRGGEPREAPTVANQTKPAPAAADDCQRVVDKVLPIMRARVKDDGGSITDADAAELVAECRREMARPDFAERGRLTMQCVLDAADDAAVIACLESAEHGEPTRPQNDAALQLNKIAKAAKVSVMETSLYPKGIAPLTPSQPCCGQPDNACPPADWSKQPVWVALEFAIPGPTRYQYSYESDGQTFVARAVADLDCDGRTVEWRMDGVLVDGNPRVTLVEPVPGAD